MAQMYNPKSGNETRGEAFVYDKFKSLLLDDDYHVFHNQITPGNEREIDFIVIHPTFGVWVIEVKDWAMDQVRVIDTDTVELRKGGLFGLGRKSIERNPLKQARDNLIHLKDAFQRHVNLLHRDGERKGKLLVPMNSFAIFTNITRAEIDQATYSDFFPVTKVWTKDFLEDPDVQDDRFERALLDARQYKFQCNLGDAQINSIKRCVGVAGVLSPPSPAKTPEEGGDGGYAETLDKHQYQLVRQKIVSQLAIEGPAGSGKSVVLLQRAIFINEEFPHWRIGIVCFNALMANFLRTMLSREPKAAELSRAIDIYDVFEWVKAIGLQSRHVSGLMNVDFLKDALDAAGWNLDKQYDALLVDEGQDANDCLLRLYRRMLLQDDCSFTFFYDGRQVLYEGSVAKALENYGFQVEEKNLVKQQRSSIVLLALAFYRHLHDGESPEQAVDATLNIAIKWFDRFPRWIRASARTVLEIAPVRSVIGAVTDLFRGRREVIDLEKELADACILVPCSDSHTLTDAIRQRIEDSVQSGQFRCGEIAVLLPDHYYAPGLPTRTKDQLRRLLTDKLKESRIPYTCIEHDNGHVYLGTEVEALTYEDNRRTADLTLDTVKVMTIHTAKGFDAKMVLIAGFDGIEKSNVRAQLGYVGLTRAKKRCEIFYCSRGDVVAALEDVFAQFKGRTLELKR